jgi:hypothetical protein
MPRLIVKCPYSKGSGAKAATQLNNYVKYVATREGVELVNTLDNYVDYIATRPRAKRIGTHGLFCDSKEPLSLSQVANAVANHPGNVWMPILSLRREDAARLGYDNAENWKALLTSFAPELAEAMKIPPEQFRWYAAFHDEGTHPHIHMICYSADGKSGFLTKNGIAQIKARMAQQIFRQELTELYQRQTQRRDGLSQEAGTVMEQLLRQMQAGTLENHRVAQLMEDLSQRLKSTTGKKQYGYLKAPLKSLVDEIVDELARDPRIAAAYDLWYQLREEVLRTYKDDLPTRLPLSQQKEFQKIKNMVIREAENIRLGVLTFEDEQMDDEPEPEQAFSRHQTHSVNEMARVYRSAKAVLYNERSSQSEQQEALSTLERLYNEGFSVAAHLLGKAWRDGVGTPTDEARAEHWFRLSANDGNDYSEYALGKLLLGQQRVAEAVDWLDRAAAQRNQFARYRLGKLYLLGDGVPKDIHRALEYLTASAEQENQFAQYTLGKLYLLGRDVPQDREAAKAWLSRSAAHGNECAKFFLARFDQFREPSVLLSATHLFRYMGQILRDNAPPSVSSTSIRIDSKRWKKLLTKRLAMGHKIDDHEDSDIQMR